MSYAEIIKSVDSEAITPEQLIAINQLTRRELSADEVYVFSMILCDNEIDRDYQCFTTDSLAVLKDLYVGKTGIFDHNPKGINQSARIFNTFLESDEGRITNSGEVYCCLKAMAYMVRCDKNNDLILEIDGGIKKEVSVSCSVNVIECSICGENIKTGNCSHHMGKIYSVGAADVMAFARLIQPTDVYEWSFVAVPAQIAAGVTKSLSSDFELDFAQIGNEVVKSNVGGCDVFVTSKMIKQLEGYLTKLQKDAALGESYRLELARDVVRLSVLVQPQIQSNTIAAIVSKMDCCELAKLRDDYVCAVDQKFPIVMQFPACSEADSSQNSAFII